MVLLVISCNNFPKSYYALAILFLLFSTLSLSPFEWILSLFCLFTSTDVISWMSPLMGTNPSRIHIMSTSWNRVLFRVCTRYSRVSLCITSWSCDGGTQIWQHTFAQNNKVTENEPQAVRTRRKKYFASVLFASIALGEVLA